MTCMHLSWTGCFDSDMCTDVHQTSHCTRNRGNTPTPWAGYHNNMGNHVACGVRKATSVARKARQTSRNGRRCSVTPAAKRTKNDADPAAPLLWQRRQTFDLIRTEIHSIHITCTSCVVPTFWVHDNSIIGSLF